MPKNPTSFRLSEECLRLVAALSETLGINQTAVIEQAVRKFARAEIAAEDLPAGAATPSPRNTAKKR
jgi:hypothetical protein